MSEGLRGEQRKQKGLGSGLGRCAPTKGGRGREVQGGAGKQGYTKRKRAGRGRFMKNGAGKRWRGEISKRQYFWTTRKVNGFSLQKTIPDENFWNFFGIALD